MPSRARRFLLVGERVCQTAATILEPLGEVELAPTAAGAVRILDEQRLSLIGFFADTDLPDGTAFDVIERAWFLDIYVPALVVSAHFGPYASEEARARAAPLVDRDCGGQLRWNTPLGAHPLPADLVRLQVERWEQRAADDQAEDEETVQRLAVEGNVDPAEIRGHVEAIKAKTRAPSLAVIARRVRWQAATMNARGERRPAEAKH